MGFFERQDVARRNSRLLLFLFFVATAVIIGLMDGVAMLLWYFTQLFTGREVEHMPWFLHAAVIGGVAGGIFFISIRKTLELRAGGGPAVAQMVNARAIVPA